MAGAGKRLGFLTLLVALGVALTTGDLGRPSGNVAADSGEILIKNATIMTASHGTIKNGSILIRNGKIAEVGTNISAPAGATVIDATGKYVIPGIIDAHSHSATDGGINEGSLSVTSMVRISDYINDRDINIYRELAGGVTAINVLHGSANAIGGQNAVLKMRWGKPAEDLVFKEAPPGIKFALGENPKRSNFQPGPGQQRRYPATRMGVEEVIRKAFTQARDYKREWDEYNARVAKGEHPVQPRRDLTLEPLVEILEGKRLVHAHCYRADEILMLIRLADEFGFKIRTFQHVLEGYKVAKEIAKHGAGASTFADFWAYKMEAYDAIPYNAAIMTRKGVNVSINSDDNERARRLNLDAAKCIKYGGLSEEEALRLVTLNPAWQLGVDKLTGSIDAGKDADLVIYDGHPFSDYSRVEKTFVDGVLYFDREKDLARRAEIVKEKDALKAKEKEQTASPRPGQGRPPRRPGE